MALEQYRTQVLLLHSQQGMLDVLSSSFNEKYSVHCATSGSEALNTLTETPIHIIVSAQDLPGMSGVDAIREAKKRSPETIGILLASKGQESALEAVVGNLEIFEIVRGDISPAALRKLVDAATRKLRMLALAESANDHAANVDQPVSEIIMETTSTGIPKITETGPLPALKTHTSRNAPLGHGDKTAVLVLTKDEEFFATIRESARGLHDVYHALTPSQTEKIVHQKKKIGVFVADAAMVGPNIDALTARLRSLSRRLVAVVAGRRDDGDMLMDLINRGQVYRFLLKPVSPGRARLAIEASVKHHLDAPQSAFKSAAKADPGATASRRSLQNTSRSAKTRSKNRSSRSATATNAKLRASTVSNAPALTSLDDAVFGDQPIADTISGLKATMSRSVNTSKDKLAAGRPDSLDAALAGDEAAGRSFWHRKSVLGGIVMAVTAGIYLVWHFTGPSPIDYSGVSGTANNGNGGRPAIVEQEIVAPARSAPAPAPKPATARSITENPLDSARLAADSGRIVSPEGNNAVEFYAAAMANADDDPVVAAEFNAVLNIAFGTVEAALLERRVDDAEAALSALRIAVADSPRLAFLDVQLNEERFRVTADRARQAIRARRYEDAASLLAQAQNLPGVNLREVDLLVDELESARSEQRVDEVLAMANRRVEEGRLTTPSNDNARYYYELALNNDSENAVARQGLIVVAGKLVLDARAAIDVGRFDVAAALLADAQALDPASRELASSLAALDAARNARENESAREMQPDTANDGTANAVGRISGPDSNSSEAQLLAAATVAGAALRDVSPGKSPSASRNTRSNTSDPESVGISSLNRTKYVSPKYPRNAMRRNITGSVDVKFTIATDGSVYNVEIIDSTPGDVFDEAASEAVSNWRFAPVIENGVAVEKQSAIRMAFDLQ